MVKDGEMSEWAQSDFITCICGNLIHKVHDTCPHCDATLAKPSRKKRPVPVVMEAKPPRPKLMKATKNGSKYHYADFVFDSKPEYERYLILQPLYKAGIIKHLCVHPTAELLPGVYPTHYKALQHDKPRKLSHITYTPDFAYVFEGVLIVEDVKGTYRKTTKQHKKGDPIITPVARLRHRILQMQRPHIIFDIVKDIEVSEFRWFIKEQKKAS